MIVSSVISRPVQVSVLSNTYAVNIAALKAIDISEMAGNTQISVAGYYTPGDGGGGTFYYDSGSSSTDDGGTVIAPDVGSGRWKRIHDGAVNVKWFGAKGDGTTNDNDAFRIASALISSYGGGALVIPPGTYVVGKQDFAGSAGLGYSYSPHDVIKITNCSSPVKIHFYGGVVIKVAAGLKYGSFDPVTGLSYTPAGGGFTNADYKASCPDVINVSSLTGGLSIYGSASIDGNSANLTAGGYWGDTGYQVGGRGIYVSGLVSGMTVSGVRCHDNVLDGMTFNSGATSFGDALSNASFYNCSFDNNGRQGVSITSGNGISFYSCEFIRTARGSVASNPKAGVDIEPNEGFVASRVLFKDCSFIDNGGCGILADIGVIDRVKDAIFDGCLFWSSDKSNVWVRVPGFTFKNCQIKGGKIAYTYEDAFLGDPDGTKFTDCTISDELYPNRSVSTANTSVATDILMGGRFDRCVFTNKYFATSLRNKIINSFYNVPHVYNDCTFANYGNGVANNGTIGTVRGALFTGTNRIIGLHTGGNSYYIYTSSLDGVQYGGSIILSGDLKWGASVAGGFDGDVAQYFRTSNARFAQVGTLTNGTFARYTSATTTPTSGQWYRGDIIINTGVAAAGQTSYWQCITSGWLASAWAPSTSYSSGAIRKNNSDFYTCVTSGTSASSGGPTGTGTGIADGTAVWDWLSSTTAVLQAKTL